jgi:hypothetical protein
MIKGGIMITILKMFMMAAVFINMIFAAQRVVVCEEAYGEG